MPRPEKVQAVADIKERIEGAQAVFLAEYAGLSVKDQQALRRSLRENGAEFKVVKMSMARLAAAELDIDTLDELLLGPTGLAFADGDPAGAAKVLKDFARSHDTFAVKGGLLGLEFLPPEKIAELAELEPRDVLLAKLAGVMQAPMANLAGLLAALPRNTASVLQQLLEKKEAAEGQSAAGSDQPSAEDDDGEEPTADGAEETEEADAAPEEEASEEAAEAADAGADTDAVGGAPKADEADDATAETDTTDEASDDAGDESDDQADEASEEDAEEE
ncbi:MAG: 50S ribosomal protein L10 [Actinobacteria bacterium]|nr:MAG: 50S ribosomal protein L10 [Actinomycetota bacterium]